MSDTNTSEPPLIRPPAGVSCNGAFGLGSLATAAMGLPIVGYLLGIVLRPDRDQWIDLGPSDEKHYLVGQTRLRNFDLPPPQPAWRRKRPLTFAALTPNASRSSPSTAHLAVRWHSNT